MSSSPAEAPAQPQWDDSSPYARAIEQADRLVSQGLSFSGREANCLFLNKTDGTFATASAITSWDYPDDSRAIGLVDWDHDGDLDAWIANRTAPQLRYLRNDTPPAQASLMLLLEGKPLRAAPGARVTVQLHGQPPMQRTVKLGEGFQSQSTRWLHFGLGRSAALEKITVRWPGGAVEEVKGCTPGGRYTVRQGTGRAVSHTAPRTPPAPPRPPVPARPLSNAILLTGEHIAPPFPGLTWEGQPTIFTDTAGPTLIHLWDPACADCLPELRALAAAPPPGLRICLLSPPGDTRSAALLRENNIPFPAAAATSETLNRIARLQRLLFGTDLPLPSPVGILLDGTGHAAAFYRGPCPPARLLSDLRTLNTKWPARAALTLPFPGQWVDPPATTNPLTLPGELAEQGHLDDAFQIFRRHTSQCAAQPGCAQVIMALAAAFEGKQRFSDAIATYRLAHTAAPAFPGALNNLAWHLAACPDPSQRRPGEALPIALQAAALTNHADPEILDTLANVQAANGQRQQAIATLENAIAIAIRANRPDTLTELRQSLARLTTRE